MMLTILAVRAIYAEKLLSTPLGTTVLIEADVQIDPPECRPGGQPPITVSRSRDTAILTQELTAGVRPQFKTHRFPVSDLLQHQLGFMGILSLNEKVDK